MYKLCGLSFTLLIVCVVVNCSSLQINETTHFQIVSKNSTTTTQTPKTTTTTTDKIEIKIVSVVESGERKQLDHEVKLGIDYEYTTNEHETLKLICPVDSDTSKWHTEEEEETDENNNDEEEVVEEDEEGEETSDDEWLSSSSDYELSNRHKRALPSSTPSQKLTLIEWFKDGVKINRYKSADRMKIDGSSLTILDATVEESGKYRCKYISGFRTLVASAVNIVVLKRTETVISSEISTTTATNKKAKGHQAPVFIGGSNKSRGRLRLRKLKGSTVRLNCRAFGLPKPDVLWFRNGQVLAEEEYGITRSKWLLDLKDLRMDDNANFTCRVFNKFGSINSTFELTVYEESQIFEGLDPLNSTITVGMDAVFNCKVKSSNQPNIKWMKQISKSEYKNYIIEETELGNKQTKSRLISTGNVNGNNDDDLNNFFALSTLPSLGGVKLNSRSTSGEESVYLADLMGGSREKSPSQRSTDQDFDFFLPSSNIEKKSSSFEAYLNRIGLKNIDYQSSDNSAAVDDESSHYITLSSPQVEERLSYDPSRNVYVSQLILKNAQIKDSGVYVCFGAGNNGYSYRKSHLKVIPSILNYKDFPFNYADLDEVKPTESSVKKQQQRQQPSLFNFQSIGFFIILAPVVVITLLALVSICYLRKLDSTKTKTTRSNRYECLLGRICCIRKGERSRGGNDGKNAAYLCCPTSTIGTHVLIPAHDSSTYEADIEFVKHQIRPYDHQKTSSPETCCGSTNKSNTTTTTTATNHCSLVSSSLSDSASSSSSTTATTVAYYATIPLLAAADCQLNGGSPPPPLPQSQPPTYIHSPPPSFHAASGYEHQATSTIDPRLVRNSQQPQQQLSRTESTPSMAYYKIVDSDLMLNGNKAPLALDNDDTMTCVSAATSRFYYQLTPSNNCFLPNGNDLRRNIHNNY